MCAISGTSFKRAADRLEQHGDPALAFRIAELGPVPELRPASKQPRSGAHHAASDQLAMNPFRFIVYSEWSEKAHAPRVAAIAAGSCSLSNDRCAPAVHAPDDTALRRRGLAPV